MLDEIVDVRTSEQTDRGRSGPKQLSHVGQWEDELAQVWTRLGEPGCFAAVDELTASACSPTKGPTDACHYRRTSPVCEPTSGTTY